MATHQTPVHRSVVQLVLICMAMFSGACKQHRTTQQWYDEIRKTEQAVTDDTANLERLQDEVLKADTVKIKQAMKNDIEALKKKRIKHQEKLMEAREGYYKALDKENKK